MGILMMCASIGAVFAAVGAAQVALRWWLIRRRPVLTCAEFASARPGTAVVVVGRTAAGPVISAYHSGVACVGFQVVRVHEHVVSDNYTETIKDPGFDNGDTRLHDDVGDATIHVAGPVRTGKMLLFNSPMMVAVRTIEDPRNDNRDRRAEREFVVPANRPVVAAGVVATRDGDPGSLFLDGDGWPNGTARGRLGGVTRRFARDVAVLLCVAVVLTALAIALSGSMPPACWPVGDVETPLTPGVPVRC
ncbi:hypothetical protein [Asanoa siamensis]|uniref:RING-type E3 ubiquitin transferase n=1 Tax=Asanoa siamensis TaxID=926357 RepID=A0ABQ4D3G7_9ACTN|nr:hypothetical protein [Asanoa siamensis]GIF78079.1 hypothetical protein Asi02nite_75970 [Asanoa siamensis]